MNYTLRCAPLWRWRTAVSAGRAGDWPSQSAVSHSIKELEAEMGVKLLDRTTREVLLSEAGQQLATRLERLLEELNTTLLDVRSYGEQRTVRVAASALGASDAAMPASSQLRYPDIR